jgi:MerR family mercuric resistance operon transcriptional regulator
METLSIGQVARRAGVGVETVRFYEREGLLEEPPRLWLSLVPRAGG